VVYTGVYMSIEGAQPHQEDHNLAFERIATDFGNTMSALHDLISSHGEIPADIQEALNTLRDKLNTYAPTH
jgi:hypothetical protein